MSFGERTCSRRRWCSRCIFCVWNTAFANKFAPTVIHELLWERTCSRRGRYSRCIFCVWNTAFADKSAPTVIHELWWERTCSRRGRCSRYIFCVWNNAFANKFAPTMIHELLWGLVRELPGTGSKSSRLDAPDTTKAAWFGAASQPFAGKSRSYALRAETRCAAADRATLRWSAPSRQKPVLRASREEPPPYGYLRLSSAGGKYWYIQVSLSVRSPVRMNMRISTGSTESLSGTQSKVMR
ncbi:putative secreted protein [Pseudomonas syringae group genomosp. 3]|uniref:Putative secreted protein n=1 Tax=Pseudomonas syringae group genomosp. 3 TaxID=251701 RepID=A0A2K4WML2_9PSED|nr:putative secreted protein [Pseudomonas syringae group genomosp. 3]SPF21217.1 putative secreted protein [Pseudomonas syringae group genomosp. 3]